MFTIIVVVVLLMVLLLGGFRIWKSVGSRFWFCVLCVVVLGLLSFAL